MGLCRERSHRFGQHGAAIVTMVGDGKGDRETAVFLLIRVLPHGRAYATLSVRASDARQPPVQLMTPGSLIMKQAGVGATNLMALYQNCGTWKTALAPFM